MALYFSFWQHLLRQFNYELNPSQLLEKTYTESGIQDIGSRKSYSGYLEVFGCDVRKHTDTAVFRDLAETVKKNSHIKTKITGLLRITVDKHNQITFSYQPFSWELMMNRYRDYQSKTQMTDELYKWELVEEFQKLWASYKKGEISFTDFGTSIPWGNLIFHMFKPNFQKILEEKTVETEAALLDLYDLQKSLHDRVYDFRDTMEKLHEQVKTKPEDNLFLSEREIATLLTFRYPKLYTFYINTFYSSLVKALNVKAEAKWDQLSHYYSIVAQFKTNVLPDYKEIVAKKNELTQDPKYYPDEQDLLLIQDIFYITLMKNSNLTDPDQLIEGEENQEFYYSLERNGYEKVKDYYDVLDQIIQHHQLQPDDKRIVFSCTKGRFYFTIVSHSVWSLFPTGSGRFSIITSSPIDKSSSTLKGLNPQLHHTYLSSIPTSRDIFLSLNSGIESLFGQSNISSRYYQEDIPDFRKSVFDKSFRRQLFKIHFGIEDKKPTTMEPLNQILYGPPGTGKTYNTIDLAVKIANPDSYQAGNHKANKAHFEELVEQSRIVFTTFHQSTSYEDFIEGIKPVLSEDENKGELGFEISPGIFQRICNSARTIKTTKSNVDWKNANFFKMSLGGKSRNDLHQYCIENSVIGLLWGGTENLEDFKKYTKWPDYREAFSQRFPDLVQESKFNIQSTYAFLHSMKVGDIVVASKGNYIIDAIGKITGDYFHDDIPQIDFNHFRKVEWIATGLNTNPSKFFKKQISQMAIYSFANDDIKNEAFEDITASTANTDENEQPYVLIIDEINRGNVAQIFGELITLIEPDKRDGKPNSISVQLPYSKESFSVPSNLFIIGTMNTADRSVEALDTALRRRFSFKEMMPQPKLLAPSMVHARFWQDMEGKYAGTIERYKEFEKEIWEFLGINIPNEAAYLELGDNKYEQITSTEELASELGNLVEYSGIDVCEILETINARIEVLLDRDHRIGHSYFMQVYSWKDLLKVMYDKVIPLLQEYFYHDYIKIAMVIGNGFLNVQREHKVSFAEFEESLASDFDEKVLIDIKPSNEVNLNEAIETLLNKKP